MSSVKTAWQEVTAILRRRPDSADGPLPPLLLTLMLAVPDLTTTVLTMTLTGIAADAALAGGHGAKLGRRALSVAAMLLGALVGGLLALKVDNPAPLALATGLLAMVSLLTYRASRSRPAWADA